MERTPFGSHQNESDIRKKTRRHEHCLRSFARNEMPDRKDHRNGIGSVGERRSEYLCIDPDRDDFPRTKPVFLQMLPSDEFGDANPVLYSPMNKIQIFKLVSSQMSLSCWLIALEPVNDLGPASKMPRNSEVQIDKTAQAGPENKIVAPEALEQHSESAKTRGNPEKGDGRPTLEAGVRAFLIEKSRMKHLRIQAKDNFPGI